MKIKCLKSTLIFLSVIASSAYSFTFTVGHGGGYNYPTITQALATSAPGDIVLVDDGEYSADNGEIFPLQMVPGVILRSIGKEVYPIINAQGTSKVIVCIGLSTEFPTKIEGFYITGGQAQEGEHGGGIFLFHSTVIIENCILVGNSSKGNAGAIYLYNSPNCIIRNCTISYNNASLRGGGISSYESNGLTIANCVISGNYAYENGGGVYIYSSSASISNSLISGNQGAVGGGIFYANSSPSLTNCVITDNQGGFGGGIAGYLDSIITRIENCIISRNSAYWDGGGIYLAEGANPIVDSCRINQNYAEEYGGGIKTVSSLPCFVNCFIYNNLARWGGGISVSSSATGPSFANCTITKNSAFTSGGGINVINAAPVLTNCILWGDDPNETDDYIRDISYSDVQGMEPNSTNINADPLFVDPLKDFHLSANSPCINKGKEIIGITRDIDDQSRPDPTTNLFDMGADEFYSGYVKPKPIICTAGYKATRISHSVPGNLELLCWAKDPNGKGITDVQIYFAGLPTGIFLPRIDQEGIFLLILPDIIVNNPMKSLIELKARNWFGFESHLWPWLIVN